MTLQCGKKYELRFFDENADVEEFLHGMRKLSRTYKLIGEGRIPWDKNHCQTYEYYLFKSKKGKIMEVFPYDGGYGSLVFYYGGEKVTTDSYSDHLRYGSKEFPEFGRNFDICVRVEITEIQDSDDDSDDSDA